MQKSKTRRYCIDVRKGSPQAARHLQILSRGGAFGRPGETPRGLLMRYDRRHANCMKNPRRIQRRGPYCLEKREIYAIQARAVKLSWKIYAEEQDASILHRCADGIAAGNELPRAVSRRGRQISVASPAPDNHSALLLRRGYAII